MQEQNTNSQSADEMSSDRNSDLQEAKQNDIGAQTDKELEIENGFFTVDDDADKVSGKDLQVEKNIPAEDKEPDPITHKVNKNADVTTGLYTSGENELPTPVKEENEKYTKTNADTIDAVFNSVLGITKGNNLSAVQNAGIPDETSEEEQPDETSEDDAMK